MDRKALSSPLVTYPLIPLVATLLFPLLVLHTSKESAVVLNMYSMGYATLLILTAVNVALLWLKPVALSIGHLASGIVLLVSGAFLWDFCVGLNLINAEPLHANLLLFAAILARTSPVQQAASRAARKWKAFPVSVADLALVAGFTVLSIIFVEVLLQSFLLVRLTPKTEHEFLSLMSRQWPEPIPVAKPEGTLRILGTADSMGVVGGASENYYYLAEKALRRDFSPRVQMVNVSVTGYEPKHELNILQFGMRYSPDVVVHSFFVGNDFTLYGEDTYELSGIRINNEEGASRLRPRHFFLADLVLNELAYRRDLHRTLLEKKTGVVDEAGYLSKGFFLAMQFNRMQFFQQSTIDKMKAVFPILDSIQHLVSEGKARYVMVINPDQTQVDKNLRQELLAKYHLREEDYDFDLPQKILRSYCAMKGILCLDLLPAFRAEGENGDLYTVRDGHYSSKGNQVAAAAITHFLIDNKLLNEPALPLPRLTSGH